MSTKKDLGVFISLVILNNKLYKKGIINETMKNKILTEINSDFYEKNLVNFGSSVLLRAFYILSIIKYTYKIRLPQFYKEVKYGYFSYKRGVKI